MKDLIIWGTGKKATEFTDKIMLWNNLSQKLNQCGVFNIKYYIDSAKDKDNDSFGQFSVLSPQEIDWNNIDDLPLIIVAVINSDEIVDVLKSKGCRNFTDYILYNDIDNWFYSEPGITDMIFGSPQISESIRKATGDEEITLLYEKVLSEITAKCQTDSLHKYLDLLYESAFITALNMIKQNECKKSLGETFIKHISLQKYVLLLSKIFAYNVVAAEKWMPRKKNNSTKKLPHTIGIYEHRLFSGGTERVVSKLVHILTEQGYEIVLFTDEIDGEREYPLPIGINRVCLGKQNSDKSRYKVLQKAIEKYNIDVYCCHMYVGYTLYDLFFVNRLGIPIILEYHQNFIINAYDGNFPLSMTLCRFADVLVTLSAMDALFWKLLGCRSLYISNPVEKPEITKSEPLPNTILWIQRIVPFQKQCYDLPEILSYVVKMVPEAKLQIVGMPDNPKVEVKLRDMFAKKGLLNHVEFCGYHKNVENFYRRATVLLLTSSFEGFSMVVAESKKYGTPIVMYELPYLELLRDGKGFIDVPQNDKYAVAVELARVMHNPLLRNRLSSEAKESLNTFAGVNIGEKWKEAFNIAAIEKDRYNLLSTQEKQFADIIKLMIKTYEKTRLAKMEDF